MGKYKIDMHTHTVASGHAYSTVTENAHYAAQTGIEYIGITDHAPLMPGSCGQLNFINLHVVPDYIEGVRVFKGVELNITDSSGKTDKEISAGLLKRLDYAIASLHLPCFAPSDEEEHTYALINAMKNKYIKIIGHPGDPRYPINIKKVVSASRDTSTLLELNNSSFNPKNGRRGGEAAAVEILRECKRQAVPVILGSDAHYHSYIGNFSYCEPLIKEAEFPDELIINYDTKMWDKFIEL